MCKTKHDMVIWVNVGLSIELIVFAIFSFINVFSWVGTGVVVHILFPVYFA